MFGDFRSVAASSSFRLKTNATPEPVEGWSCWTDGICEMIGGCESEEALNQVCSRQAGLLTALSRSKPDLYPHASPVLHNRPERTAARVRRKGIMP